MGRETILVLGESNRERCNYAVKYCKEKAKKATILLAAGINPTEEGQRMSVKMMEYMTPLLKESGMEDIIIFCIGEDRTMGTAEEMVETLDYLQINNLKKITFLSEKFHLPRIKMIWEIIKVNNVEARFVSPEIQNPDTGDGNNLEWKKKIWIVFLCLVYKFLGKEVFYKLSAWKNKRQYAQKR